MRENAVAAMLAEEFGPVDNWPSGSVKLHCQRDSSDCSAVRAEPGFSTPLSVGREIDQLGLGEAHAVR